MLSQRRVGLVLAVVLALSVSPLQTPSALGQKELFLDCEPEDATAPPETNSPIVCTVSDANSTGQVGILVDAEVLAGSTHDHDDTTSPPDYEYATDTKGQATLPFTGTAEGADSICLWIDGDGINDNINEGDSGCIEDSNTDVVMRTWQGEAFDEVPVLDVRRNGIPSGKADRLREALDIDEKVLLDDGSIFFVDPKRFAKVPTKPADAEDFPADEDGMTVKARAIDFSALRAIKVLPATSARRKIGNALKAAGLAPSDLLPVAFRSDDLLVDHGTFETLGAPGANYETRSAIPHVEVALDTQVSYQLSFKKTPVVGPGVNFRAAFDGNGNVTLLSMSARKLVEGKEIGIMSPQQAVAVCNGNSGTDGYDQAQLVYYSPPSSFDSATTVYPHYACNGTGTAGGDVNATEYILRELFVPAAIFDFPPSVEVSASSSGGRVTASSTVVGGTPPYRYEWSSHTIAIPSIVPTTNNRIAYDVQTREESGPITETVGLTVTDADGLAGYAEESLTVNPLPLGTPPATTAITIGTWYVGMSYNRRDQLSGPAPNTQGFEAGMASIADQLYSLGELEAWERDFKDADAPAYGTANDTMGTDNVDMFWFTGHASADGWPLAAYQSHDDNWVAPYETRWGERDLEWAAIAACGPLQEISNGRSLRQRWGQAFEGLHILNGYATVSNDNDREGGLLASYLSGSVGSFEYGSLSVRQSWAAMAIAVQGPDVIHASMGPIAADGASNYGDYFWGEGPVGPDIRGTQIRDFWVYRGHS